MVFLLILTFLSCGVQGENSTSGNETNLWDTVKDAYVFSYPLVLMEATMQKRTNTVQPNSEQAPVNQLFHVSSLATPDSKDMVAPSRDTVYSEAFLNLNKTALVFVKPKTDRFCAAQIMDAYSNTITVAGSGGKLENPQDEQICLITGKNYQGDVPEGMTQISVPTDLVWLFIRTVCNGPDDLPNVTAIQKQMRLIPLEEYLSNQTYIPANGSYHDEFNFVPSEHVDNMSATEFFTAANRLMITNPPAPADAPIVEEMKSVNVGPGLVFDEKKLGDNSSLNWKQMIDSVNPILNNSYYMIFPSSLGSWMYFGDPIADWGTDYAYRTMVSKTGYGANPTYIAIYPITQLDSNNQRISGKNDYKLHFENGMIPPIRSPGFWSVTAYDPDSFLIPNDINRYSLNNRDNLTYNSDGSLDILLQSKAPDQAMLNNWLPTGNDYFHLAMRMYLPDMNAVTSTWTPPVIVKQ